MLQNNVIYEWITAFAPKRFFLVITEAGSLEFSKEPYASYIEPQWTLFSKNVHYCLLTKPKKINVEIYSQ